MEIDAFQSCVFVTRRSEHPEQPSFRPEVRPHIAGADDEHIDGADSARIDAVKTVGPVQTRNQWPSVANGAFCLGRIMPGVVRFVALPRTKTCWSTSARYDGTDE